MGVWAGDKFNMTAGNGKTYILEVVSIVENYTLHYVYMSPEIYRELFKTEPAFNGILIVTEKENEREFSERLLTDENIRAVVNTEDVRKHIAESTDALKIVTVVLIVLACALALVVLFNLTNINITERIRELATIKVLGFYDSEIAMFQAVRVGDESANTTILRKAGFMSYYNEYGLTNKLHKVPYSAVNPEQNDELIGDFFEKNPGVKGAVVLNSRGNIIADYFKKRSIRDIKFVCIDLTETNIKALKDGYIHFIMGQRPDQQGFMAMESFLRHLIYGQKMNFENYMPIDIIAKENVDLFTNTNTNFNTD